MNVSVFLFEKKNLLLYLDNTTYRHSLYESATQNSTKVKRTETIPVVHSAGTNNITPKRLATNDRRLYREGKNIKSH